MAETVDFSVQTDRKQCKPPLRPPRKTDGLLCLQESLRSALRMEAETHETCVPIGSKLDKRHAKIVITLDNVWLQLRDS